jgi:hypothetical protein
MEDTLVAPPSAAPTTPRIRRTADQLLEAEVVKLAKLVEAVAAQETKIGKLREAKLDTERRTASIQAASQLADAARELSPEEILAVLAEVKARREAPVAEPTPV